MKIFRLFFIFFFVQLFTGEIFSQNIPLIKYQGILKNSSGVIVANGEYNITFRLYDAAENGNVLWTETKQVDIVNGIFNINLGDVTPLNLSFDIKYWLGMTVESGDELVPRTALTSVPYSIMTMNVMDGSVTNAKIHDNAVTSEKINDGAITGSDLGDNSVNGSKISDNSITGSDIASEQVVRSLNGLKDSVVLLAGSNIALTPSGNTITISSSGGSGGGDITAVIADSGLTGGGTTGDVTLSVAHDGITNLMIQDNAVTTSKISNGTILSNDIASNQLVKNVNGIKDSVTLIAGSNVSINTNGSSITISSSGGTGGGDITAVNAGNGLTGGGTVGDVTLSIPSLGITYSMLQDDIITSTKILDGTILTSDIGDNVVSSVKILDLGVSTADLQNSSVTTIKLANQSVTQDKLAAGLTFPPSGTAGGDLGGTYPSPSVVKILGRSLSAAIPTTGQVLGWSGSNWTPVDQTLTLPFTGSLSTAGTSAIYVEHTATTGTNYGINLKINSTSGNAVFGTAPLVSIVGISTGTTGTSYGVYGETHSSSGRGLLGAATSLTGTTYGCYARSYSNTGFGVYGYASYSSGTNYGVYGVSNSDAGYGIFGTAPTYGIEGRATNSSGIADGIRGISYSTGGTGVFGYANSTSSLRNYGGYFTTQSLEGVGVIGLATATSTGHTYGVMGLTYNSLGHGVHGESNYMGVYGLAAPNTGTNYGVRGETNSPSGYGVMGKGPIYGVYGWVTATEGSRSAIYGFTTGLWGQERSAGYFAGHVNVTGSVFEGVSCIKIDHPQDPENKFLYQPGVHSSEMMNIYNGNVTTDGRGYATVTMPGWFDALNKDFRYQLTVIGDFAQAIISREVENNSFEIRTDKPSVKVSWQVTGVRKDPLAQFLNVSVEENKKPEERGKYIIPEAYGLPEERGIDADQIRRLKEDSANIKNNVNTEINLKTDDSQVQRND